MIVTVAICTWNRARLLDKTLAELHNLRIPPEIEWELLVVNNNCTDDTDDVVARHAKHLPLRRLFEPAQGLSNARNCAVAAARGDLILWTDDDVLVDSEWLAAYVSAAEKWPDAVYFGGTIEPWFEMPPPRWVRENVGLLIPTFSLRQLDGPDGPFPSDENPFGANIAFRRSAFDTFRFNPRLGVNGAHQLVGEEMELIQHLKEAGSQGVWVGSARVRHFLPAERVSTRFVWEWSRGLGRSYVRSGKLEPCAYLWGAPRWVWRRYWEMRLKACVCAPFRGPRWLKAYKQAAVLRGIIDEVRSLRSGNNTAIKSG